MSIATSEITGVNFRLKTSTVNQMGFQLLFDSDFPKRIAVEVRAHRWGDGETNATVEQYSKAAKDMVGNLLKGFNALYRKRYRLIIVQPKVLPEPSQRSLNLFSAFCGAVNRDIMHPNDWIRFYGLVGGIRQNLKEETVWKLFRKGGFAQTDCDEMTNLYEHLRNFKSLASNR